ncbi:hypothetical protein [Spirosoma gilvum]
MIKTAENYFIFKVAACCAVLSALTTFLLWYLPRQYSPPSTPEESWQLATNGFYMAKNWVNLFHIPLTLTGYAGLTFYIFSQASTLTHTSFKAFLAMIWFIIWGLIEMVGMAIIIFTVNQNWRAAFPSANAAGKGAIIAQINVFNSVWDSLFFVLLLAFLFGSLFIAWATWSFSQLRILSYLFWLAVPLTFFIIIQNYADVSWAAGLVTWIYPILQPLSRLMLGVFLWRNFDKNTFLLGLRV